MSIKFILTSTEYIELPNPILGNTKTTNMNTKINRTMDGGVFTYISTPKKETLTLSFNTLTKTLRDSFETFLGTVSGQYIYYQDFEDTVWYGQIVSTPNNFDNYREGLYGINIVFYGSTTDESPEVVTIDSDTVINIFGGFITGNVEQTANYQYSPSDGGLGVWDTKTPLPSPPRAGLTGVSMDGKAYSIGGYDAAGPIYFSDTDQYTPGTDSWVAMTDAPSTARALGVTKAVGNKAYYMGGLALPGPASVQDVAEFDADTDTWTSKASMPAPARYVMAGHSSSSSVYILGGYSGSTNLADFDKYTPSNNTWSSLSNYSSAIRELGGDGYPDSTETVNENGVYCGGYTSSRQDTTVRYYNDNDFWETLGDLTVARFQHQSFAFNTDMFLMGGNDGVGYQTDTEQYENDRDIWIRREAMPAGLIYHNGATLQSTPDPDALIATPSTVEDFTKAIYSGGRMVGGSVNPSGGIKDTLEWASSTWTTKTDSPSPSEASSAFCTIRNMQYVFGGAILSTEARRYSPDDNDWIVLGVLPINNKSYQAAFSISDIAYVCGGSNSTNAYGVLYNGLLVNSYSVNSDSWEQKNDLPCPARRSHGSAVVNGEGFLVGGNDNDNGVTLATTDKYTSSNDTWESETDLPSPTRRSIAVGVVSDRIIISGGYTTDGVDTALLDTAYYTPSTQVWSTSTDISCPERWLCRGVGIGTDFFSAGGLDNGSNYLQDTDKFVLSTEIWSSDTSLPSPGRHSGNFSTINDSAYNASAVKGYAWGGINLNDYLPYNEEYYALDNTWTLKSDVPAPMRKYAAGLTIGSDGFLWGGESVNGLLADNNKYQSAGDGTWTTGLTDINSDGSGRSQMAACEIDSKGYAFGGWINLATLRTDEYVPGTDTWTNRTDYSGSLPKYAWSVFSNGTDAYIHGGYDSLGYAPENYEYDPNTWTAKMPLYEERAWHTSCYISPNGYTFGGKRNINVQASFRYVISTDTWEEKTNTLQLKYDSIAVPQGSYIYFFGGYDDEVSLGACDEYYPTTDSWAEKIMLNYKRRQLAGTSL